MWTGRTWPTGLRVSNLTLQQGDNYRDMSTIANRVQVSSCFDSSVVYDGKSDKEKSWNVGVFYHYFFFHLLGVATIMLDAGANNAPIVTVKQIRYSARWANGSALKSLKFAENKWTAV